MSKTARPSGNKMNLRARKSKPPTPPPPSPPAPVPAARLSVCGLCDAECAGVEACAAHMLHEHVARMKLCPQCARAFLTDQQLREHMAKHKRRSHGIFSCAHCPVHFSQLSLLERHEYERHERDGPGMCLARYLPYLSACVNTNFVLFYNTLRARSAAVKVTCKVCRFHSTSLDEYLQHIKEKCGKKYVCDRCGNIFIKRKSLQMHYSKNNKCKTPGYAPSLLPATKKATKCSHCKKKFTKRESYYAHVKKCSRYECKKCDLAFDSLSEYNAHHSELHNEPLKLFNCAYCRMEFVTQRLLERHTKQHERYSCLECDKKYGTPKPLLLHLKMAHPSVHPYKCLICDTSFQEGLHFKTHITSHEDKGYVNFDKNHFVTYSYTAPTKTTESGEVAEANNATESTGVDKTDSADVAETLNAADKTNDDTDEEVVKDAKKTKKATIRRKATLRDRRSTYNAKKTFQCKVCSKRTGDLVAYNKHVNMHFQKGAKQCVHCAKIFRNQQALDKHELEMHKTNDKNKTSNKLHKYLKERAERKLQAIRAMNRARPPQKRVLILPELPKPPPFKMRLKRVAAPTYDVIQNGQIVTNSKEVTIRDNSVAASAQKLRDLTVQSYVESFQPDQTMDATEENNEKQKKSIKRLTMNKSLKIRSVRSTVASKMFKIKTKKFQEPKPNVTPTLSKPVPYKKIYTEPVNVNVTMMETYKPRIPCLDFGEDPRIIAVYEDVYDADYFETDDDNVAQIEVLSTPAPPDAKKRVQVQKGKKYMLEVSGEPTTEEIEEKLAEVCQKLEFQVPKNDLHIGQLTTSAPFYKVIHVKRMMQKHAKQKREENIKKRFEELKIGSAQMVIANPLEHLMKKANITLGDRGKAKRNNVKPPSE